MTLAFCVQVCLGSSSNPENEPNFVGVMVRKKYCCTTRVYLYPRYLFVVPALYLLYFVLFVKIFREANASALPHSSLKWLLFQIKTVQTGAQVTMAKYAAVQELYPY